MSEPKQIKTKHCVICGTEFTYLGHEKCCGNECKKINQFNLHVAYIEKQKNIKVTRHCKICNKQFETDEYHNRTTCGKECYEVAVAVSNIKPGYTYTNNLDEIEAEARRNGMRYADVQKRKTLDLAGKIDINVGGKP